MQRRFETPKGSRRSFTVFRMTLLWEGDDGAERALWSDRRQTGDSCRPVSYLLENSS